MKYFSTFSGIGGFEIGIHAAYIKHALISKKSEQKKRPQRRERAIDQWKLLLHSGDGSAPLCVGYSEIDKYASSVYEYHFKGAKNYGDITKINASELPEFDCLVGGFPCQAFSVAGKRGGFNDTRGTLFFNLARILREKQPRYFVFENVKGLLSHDQGRTFATIISTIDELGYDCQWQVLNSKNFGVPQNRERIIIVGHLRGTPRPEVFPIRAADKEDTRVVGQDVAYTIDANYHKGTNTLEKSRRSIVEVTGNKQQSARVYDKKGISPSLNTMQGGNKHPKIPVLTPDRLKKRQNGRRFKEDGDPSFTLNTQDRHGVYDGAKIRRLTPLECERLQAFPDNWTKHGVGGVLISDTQRYKMCGNAVTTNVIQAVFEKIFDSQKEESNE